MAVAAALEDEICGLSR